LFEYRPLFERYVKTIYSNAIKGNPELKEYFLRRFNEYEFQAYKDLLIKRESFFIGHYDSSKKSRRRWCSITKSQLASVEIDDNRYSLEYKPLIKEIVDMMLVDSSSTNEQIERRILFKTRILFEHSAAKLLKELGWPEFFIPDKIQEDIFSNYIKLV
jgi:hypothetical protein